MKTLTIRPTDQADLPTVLRIHREAFGEEDVAGLTAALLADPTAEPVVSLLAFAGDEAVGHILFTAVGFEPGIADRGSILAPLGVVPSFQGRAVGSALVEQGLRELSGLGVELVFVLGHPGYYPRFGFRPAGALGFAAPYPIPEKNSDAWMALALSGELPKGAHCTVRCARMLDRPEYWRE